MWSASWKVVGGGAGALTWKKLVALVVALADILSEIRLFRGHFESNIQ